MIPTALTALITANPAADAAGILALARSDPRMARPIAAADLNPWLGNNGITPRLERTADFIAALDIATARSILAIDSAIPDANVPIIARLTADQLLAFTAYAGSGLSFAVDTAEVAGKAVKLLMLCQGLNAQNPTLGVTAAEAASLVALGGGYQVFDVTLDQVTAALAVIASNAAFTALYAQVDAPWNDANTLRNARYAKLGTIQENGGTVPASLAALDALAGGEA